MMKNKTMAIICGTLFLCSTIIMGTIGCAVNATTLPVYTVTYDSNGGTTVRSESVVEGQTAKRPVPPTKDGYAFAGWKEADVGAFFDFNTKINRNYKLFAMWDPARISAEPDPQGVKITIKLLKTDIAAINELKSTGSYWGYWTYRIYDKATGISISNPEMPMSNNDFTEISYIYPFAEAGKTMTFGFDFQTSYGVDWHTETATCTPTVTNYVYDQLFDSNYSPADALISVDDRTKVTLDTDISRYFIDWNKISYLNMSGAINSGKRDWSNTGLAFDWSLGNEGFLKINYQELMDDDYYMLPNFIQKLDRNPWNSQLYDNLFINGRTVFWITGEVYFDLDNGQQFYIPMRTINDGEEASNSIFNEPLYNYYVMKEDDNTPQCIGTKYSNDYDEKTIPEWLMNNGDDYTYLGYYDRNGTPIIIDDEYELYKSICKNGTLDIVSRYFLKTKISCSAQWAGPEVAVEDDWTEFTVEFNEAPSGVQFVAKSDAVSGQESWGTTYHSTYPQIGTAIATVNIAEQLERLRDNGATRIDTITIQNTVAGANVIKVRNVYAKTRDGRIIQVDLKKAGGNHYTLGKDVEDVGPVTEQIRGPMVSYDGGNAIHRGELQSYLDNSSDPDNAKIVFHCNLTPVVTNSWDWIGIIYGWDENWSEVPVSQDPPKYVFALKGSLEEALDFEFTIKDLLDLPAAHYAVGVWEGKFTISSVDVVY